MTRLWHAIKREQATALRPPFDGRVAETAWDRGYAAGQADAAAALQEDIAAMISLAEVRATAGTAGDRTHRGGDHPAGGAAVDQHRRRGADRHGAAARARPRRWLRQSPEDWGAPTLLFHPDDLALTGGETFGDRVKADADIPRGSVRAVAGAAWAADGIAEAIARVSKAAGL